MNCAPDSVGMNRSRRMKWTGNVTGMGDRRGAFTVSVGRPEEKSQLGRLWRRWNEVSQ